MPRLETMTACQLWPRVPPRVASRLRTVPSRRARPTTLPKGSCDAQILPDNVPLCSLLPSIQYIPALSTPLRFSRLAIPPFGNVAQALIGDDASVS